MSGFTGFISKIDNKNQVIKKMTDKIKHRGPDGEDYFNDENITIGFRKLKVTSETGLGFNEDKTLIIALDGQIYNALDLKKKLIKRGHKFNTENTAEVVVHGYEEYGKDIFAKLRGMFSFVLYDFKNKELIGVRDFFGIKPIYYYHNKETFLFGSEIKSFMEHPNFEKELNEEALKPFLSFQYSVLDETFFKNVYRLNPGEYFVYKNKKVETFKYFELNITRDQRDYEKLKKELAEVLENSIDIHKKASNVEIGSYLSGGVDSSYVVSAAKPKKTFTIGFENKGFDETRLAKDLSDILKLKNYSKHIDADDFFDALPKVLYHTDEPHANLSAVPLFYLSKLAASKVKVVLSGEGADELFAGYNEYNVAGLSSLYLKLPFVMRRLIGRATQSLPSFKGKNSLMLYAKRVEDSYIGVVTIMNSEEANNILRDKFKSELTPAKILKPYYDKVKGLDNIAKKMYIDMNFWLPKDMLLKGDKMSMAHGLELRVPLLDKEVYDIASTITVNNLVKNNETKYIFRNIAHDVIPEEWAKRRKLGIPVPFSIWLKDKKYYEKVKEIFNEEFTNEIFDINILNEMLDKHYKGIENNGRKLYAIYCFLVWYKVYFIPN